MRHFGDEEFKKSDFSVPQQRNLQVYVLFDDDSILKNLAPAAIEQTYFLPEERRSVMFGFGPFSNSFKSALLSGNFNVNDFVNYDTCPGNYKDLTIAFYWKSFPMKYTIVEMSYQNENENGEMKSYLNVTSDGNDLTLAIANETTPITIGNVFSQGSFKFVAIQYSAYDKIVNVFDEKGDTLKSISIDSANLVSSMVRPKFLRTRVNLGFGSSSAISCLSVHSSLLSPAEIRQLPCSCQFKTQKNSSPDCKFSPISVHFLSMTFFIIQKFL